PIQVATASAPVRASRGFIGHFRMGAFARSEPAVRAWSCRRAGDRLPGWTPHYLGGGQGCRIDSDVVVHGRDPRGSPGGLFRLMPLGPGTNLATQGDIAAIHFHADLPGVVDGRACEGLLDALLYVCRMQLGPNRDEVRDAPDPRQITHGRLRG